MTVFDGAELTDTSTAGTTSVVATGGDFDASGLGVLSGTLDVSDGARGRCHSAERKHCRCW